MNAQAQEVESEVAAPSAKSKTVVEVVEMEDGRKVEFAGKRKVVKEYFLTPDGALDYIVLDFRNGMTRKIVIPPSLLGQFAGHGALQKYGDELAGLKGADGGEPDIDDMVLTIDALDETVDQVKAFLKDKDAKFKAAIRADDKKPNEAGLTVAAIVKRLEAEKASRGTKFDTSAALADLDSI